MKLISKISLYNLILMMLIYLVLGVVVFSGVKYIYTKESKDDLYDFKDLIEDQIQNGIFPSNPPYLVVEKLEGKHKKKKDFKVIKMKDYDDDSVDDFYELIAVKKIKGAYYRISIRSKIIESEEFLETIFKSLIALFFVQIVITVIVNYRISKKLFKPFYQILEELKKFSVSSPDKTNFQLSGIHEFEVLKESLNQMIDKIINDYSNLKEFTENAAHELQTPLSIMQNKIENIIQTPNLDKDVLEEIISIQKSISRLRKLNKSLLLLAKVESSTYYNTEEINLNEIVQNNIDRLNDIIDLKEIKLEIEESQTCITTMNRDLADILIANLIENAIKHSHSGALLQLTIHSDKLIISNSGDAIIPNSAEIFERFAKGNQSDSSHGLGLAIVAKICNLFGIKIRYSYKNSMHNFTLEV